MNAAWITARLTAYAPVKARNFTKVEKLLISHEPKGAQRQTWQDQLAVAQQWTAAVSKR